MGKIGGVAWSLQCWEDPINNESASLPAKVENKQILKELEGLLLPVPEEENATEYSD
jgi:hypothetical protein